MAPKASSWLILAITSGACAAFNGVFAKLTTTSLTTTWSTTLSSLLNLSPENKITEYTIRALFFTLNLLFNAIMWTLFTKALTLASSTTRVSIINTSANFFITAILGVLVFGETLGGLWWVGAGMLIVGSVVIGMREEGGKEGKVGGGGEGEEEGTGLLDRGGFRDSVDGEGMRREGDGEGEDVELVSVGDDEDEGSEVDGDVDAVLK